MAYQNTIEALGAIGSADDFETVTPSDSVDLTYTTVGIEVGVAGDVAVTTAAGNSRTLAATAGRIYPIRVTRIKSTGTTATGIIAYYFADL